MSEVEKQESQKTVVAFITGLLIGGLLVWVFSSTPESKVEPKDEKTNTEEVAKGETKTEDVVKEETKTETVGTGSLTVSEQKAGKVVAIGKAEFPTKKGWVVVREFANDTAGNILGAAEFNAEIGLVPTNVELMRETISGGTYQVVFFTNEGDEGFATTEDKLVDGIATSFKAN